jgi:5-methylcytosine-specific restriction endonuclease McrA
MSDSIPQNPIQCTFNFIEFPQKQCCACKQWFAATTDFFYPAKAMRDGLTSRCIPCRSDYMRNRYAIKHPNAKPRTGERVAPPEQKVCSKCGQSKQGNAENFGSHERARDGLYGACRECRNKQATETAYKRHQENPPVFSEDVLKKCSGCSRELPATPDYFHLNKRKRDGLNHECRHCASRRTKTDRLENPEKYEWRQFMYRDANRDKIRESGRAYYRAHMAESNAKWRRRDSQIQQNGGSFTARDVLNQVDKQNSKCYWCNKQLEKYHVDHVIPVIRGGSDNLDNIVLACPFCNQSKGSKTIEEWLIYLEKFILTQDPDDMIS